jgi:putative spermidine/putrescine transport system permease protein
VTMVQILVPFVIMPCLSAMSDVDQGLVRAARVLGASPGRAFLAVFLPLTLEGAVTGFVIVFMLGMGFFITPALVGGPQDTMMANLIATQVEHTNWGFAAALAIVLLLATLAVMLVVRAVARRILYAPGREGAR